MVNNYLTLSVDHLKPTGPATPATTVMTVYDRWNSRTLFVNVNDDALSVTTVDIFRHDLEAAIIDGICQPFEYLLDCADWQTSFNDDKEMNGSAMQKVPFEICQLISRCLSLHMQHVHDSTGRIFDLDIRQLPFELAWQITADYTAWVNCNTETVKTDGYKILIDPEYLDFIKQ